MLPGRPSSRRLVFAFVLVTVLGTVAVVAVLPSGAKSTDPNPIGHDAAERFSALDGVAGTVVQETTVDGETNRTVYEVKRRPGTGMVWSKTRSGPGTGADRTVSNGTVTWLYDSDENDVTRLDRSHVGYERVHVQRIEQLFEALNVTTATTDTRSTTATPGVSPLPVLPPGGGPSASVDETAGRVEMTGYNVSYIGTDTVAGRDVYGVRVEAIEESASSGFANYSQTMWVDAEYFYPLKRHTSFVANGRTVSVSITYRNVTFDPGLDDATFTFEPPANATIERDDGPKTIRYDSADELRANVSGRVPDPDVAPTFDLDSAFRTTDEYRAVGLQYSNATAELTVVRSDRSLLNRSDGRSMRVGTRTGRYYQFATTRIVTWSCGGYRYTVTGSWVSRETLIQVASSVACA